MAASLAAIIAACGLAAGAHAAPTYVLAGSFAAPSGSWDVLSDGRLIAVSSDGTIRVQSAVNAGGYAPVGSVDGSNFAGPLGNFGASFLRVSPDGTRLAIGDNGAFNRVHLVPVSGLSTSAPSATTFIAAPNLEASWSDNQTLYVSGFGAGPIVSRLDTTGATATPVINAIGDGSGGVAIRSGTLFTGIGYDSAPGSPTVGNIRAFTLASLAAASSPVAFSTGTIVADALTAATLDFDAQGNLIVGGGDFFGGSNDFGYAAAFDQSAITAALLGAGPAGAASRQQLSPAGPDFYSTRFNAATGELLVGTSSTIYRFVIPAPGAAAMLMTLGLFAARRRR